MSNLEIINDISYENTKKIINDFKLQFSDDDLKSIRLRKIDRVWIYLFCKYNILKEVQENSLYKITATQIKDIYEPKLSVKFDHRRNLPVIFKNNNLVIFPDTRETYIISNYKIFKNFGLNNEERNLDPEILEIPDYLCSLNKNDISSKTIALNTAYLTGIIADFVEDDEIFPTISGRMACDSFNFNIETYENSLIEIDVDMSQIKIYAAYEGINYLSIIEAKLNLSDDFLIWQLYYPLRILTQKVHKKVKPIFLSYSNNVFNLYEYSFKDIHNYNSLELVKFKKYSLIERRITLDLLLELIEQTKVTEEPSYIPFVQANDFNKLINLCELLKKDNFLSREEIANIYDFNERQSDYYCNAGIYLRLIAKDFKIYSLSKVGKKIFSLSYFDRQIEILKLIFEHEPIRIVLKEHLHIGRRLSQDEAFSLLKDSKLSQRYNSNTIHRRSGTVASWCNWIIDLLE